MAMNSILHSSVKGNTFPEDEAGGEPKLIITEQPKSRGFRFRYNCEGPSHGGVPGAGSDKNKKTYPAVQIVNHQGYARIVVQLVTNEENPRLHPHSLVGKQCQNGICTVQCGPKDMTSTFPNLGIQHITKKNVAGILEERYIAAEMQLSSINDGFPQSVQKNIKDEDRKRIAAKAQSEAKSIDLSVVRLMFIAYLPDSNGAFTVMLKPVISEAIFDSKSPNAATLKICRMDCNSGSAVGGDEVYLLCDKVQKDDIQVRFYEEDMQGTELWDAYGNFNPTDVHRQFAIVFRTPAYRDPSIKQPVHVYVQLRRRTDGEVSEPRPFTYTPNKDDYDMIDRKRRKVSQGFRNYMPGNGQGYNFQMGSSNSPQGMFPVRAGSPGNGNKIREARPPPIKQEDPQKGPLDPSVLFKLNSIKQEPRSPHSRGYGSRNSSFQGSPRSTGSPMSESSSPRAPSPPSEPECFPGTQVPIPRAAKMRAGLPKISFSQSRNVASNSPFQVNQTQARLAPTTQTYFNVQEQQMQFNDFSETATYASINVDNQLYIEDSQNSGSGSCPTGDTAQLDSGSPYSNQGWISMQTVSPEEYIEYSPSYDQNHNPLQTINSNDIVNRAMNETVTGPGSGSIGLSTVHDPLMPAPLSLTNDLGLNFLTQQCSLSEMTGLEDIFNDIESDAGREKDIQGSFASEEHDFGEVMYGADSISSSGVASDSISSYSATRSSIQADGDIEADAAGSLPHRMAHMGLGNTKEGPPSQYLAQKPNFDDVASVKEPEKLRTKPKTAIETIQREEITVKRETKQRQQTLGAQEVFKIEEAKKVASAIHDFSVTGDIRMLLVLQRHLTSCKDANGDTAIHVAVIHDQLEALSCLLDVVKTVGDNGKIIDSVNKQQQTALHIAVLTDNIEAVIDLLRIGADPLIVDKNGNHAIHVATRHGNPDILRRLLRSRKCQGKEFDILNHNGLGLFHLAVKAKKNNRQCLKILNEYDCDVSAAHAKSGQTALHMAVEVNNIVVAGCLVSECDANLEVATYDGYTALHVASANNSIEIAALLLACEANADASTLPPHVNGGERPIDLAQSDKMRDILRGKNIQNGVDCESLLQDPILVQADLWWMFDPIQQNRLCNLLNAEKTGSDWYALANRLDLSSETSKLKTSENPTDALIKLYSAQQGTCEGLRSALVGIGRHDAVQLMNKALNTSPECLEFVKDVESIMQKEAFMQNEERFDSAIGSLPSVL